MLQFARGRGLTPPPRRAAPSRSRRRRTLIFNLRFLSRPTRKKNRSRNSRCIPKTEAHRKLRERLSQLEFPNCFAAIMEPERKKETVKERGERELCVLLPISASHVRARDGATGSGLTERIRAGPSSSAQNLPRMRDYPMTNRISDPKPLVSPHIRRGAG